MSPIFFSVFLCLAPLAVIASYHNTADGFYQSSVQSRSMQCTMKAVKYIGECTMSRGKTFANYLEEDSCAHLWCIIKDTDDKFVCEDVGLPELDTPCGARSVCRNGKCVSGGFHFPG